MDPFREDLALGFKKLTNKDEIFLKALKYSLYHDGHIPSLTADASPGLMALKNKWGPSNPENKSEDPWTQRRMGHSLMIKWVGFIRNTVDEMLVDVCAQMEKDGYDQLENYALPNELTKAVLDWTWEEMVKLGFPDLRDRVDALYL